MEIRLGGLDRPEVGQLLREHLLTLAQYSPPESMHALDLESLRRPEITFWSVWGNGDLMGCGALKELDSCHGEIKSMRTAATHLRQGVAARLLRHILKEASRRAYQRLSLETGSMGAFAPGAATLRRRWVPGKRSVCRLCLGSEQRLHDQGTVLVPSLYFAGRPECVRHSLVRLSSHRSHETTA